MKTKLYNQTGKTKICTNSIIFKYINYKKKKSCLNYNYIFKVCIVCLFIKWAGCYSHTFEI